MFHNPNTFYWASGYSDKRGLTVFRTPQNPVKEGFDLWTRLCYTFMVKHACICSLGGEDEDDNQTTVSVFTRDHQCDVIPVQSYCQSSVLTTNIIITRPGNLALRTPSPPPTPPPPSPLLTSHQTEQPFKHITIKMTGLFLEWHLRSIWWIRRSLCVGLLLGSPKTFGDSLMAGAGKTLAISISRCLLCPHVNIKPPPSSTLKIADDPARVLFSPLSCECSQKAASEETTVITYR